MKTAQLIKREEKTLYLSESGEVMSLSGENEKLAHIITGKETKLMITESIEARFRGKNNKDLDTQFWAYMQSENLDSRNYYLIIES